MQPDYLPHADAKARALAGYVLTDPVTLTATADFLAIDHLIWPICLAGCVRSPPLHLPSIIMVKGQRYTLKELMRHVRCQDCGTECEICITPERARA